MRSLKLAFVISGLFAVTAFAQESTQATITGFVNDQSQAAVPNTEVSVISHATGLVRTARTDERGIYTVVGLQPGTYDLKATAPGFKTVEQTGVILNVGSSVRVNFSMELGAVTETVMVRDVAPLLKTETGEVSNLVSGTQVTELALNGRNFTQFLALGTGVSSQQSGRQMGLGQEGNPLMSVNGGRITMNKFTYDGTLAMDSGGNRGLDLFPPMEAIGEVMVQKSNYGADAGGFGYGIVNIVTKAGGQTFHGDIYEYFRNDKLDARNFFSGDRQAIRLNNFGYTLGGPFYIPGKYNTDKTKDFFFWSQSWSRRVGPQIFNYTTPPQGVFTATVPTTAMRAGDFTGAGVIRDPSGQPYPNNRIPASQFDSNAVLLLNTFYLLPNRAGSPNYVYNTRSFTKYREELLRWDHNFNQNWSWTTRYAQDTWTQDQDINRPGPSLLPTFPNLSGKPGKNLNSKLTTIIRPTIVNLLTFGYSFNEIFNVPIAGERPPGLNVPQAYPSNQYNRIPDITLAQGFTGIGVGDLLNNDNPIYTWKDDLAITRGRHNLKFGAELIWARKRVISYSNEQGSFNFNGGVTGHSVADFLIGRAFTYTENDVDPGIEFSSWDNEFYAQDDFKVSSRLTVNLGVRWYLIRGSNGGAAKGDRISTFVASLYDPAKAPQLLSAGQLVPGTGDPLNGIITAQDRRGIDIGNSLMQPQNHVFGPRVGIAYSLDSRTVIRTGYGINYFWGTANNVNRRSNPPFTSSVNIQNPLLSDPLGGAGRTFPSNVASLDMFSKQPGVMSWSFTVQRELAANTGLEVSYTGTRGWHLPRSIQLNQANPFLPGNANLRRPYLGYGNIPYNENTAGSRYNGLGVSLTRRFSHGFMFEVAYTFSKGLGHAEGNPVDSRNKDLDWGLTDLDRTHAFTYNAVWEMPFFKGQKGVAAKIFGGWQISGIASLQSGMPFAITQAGDTANFGGGTGAQRPDMIGDPNKGRGASLARYFNTDAFRAVTGAGHIGTAPVNAVRGPGINNVDLSLFKNIRPRENVRLQVGMETFNLFNHPQFETVGGQINSPTFGVVTSARDPRVMQARVRVSF